VPAVRGGGATAGEHLQQRHAVWVQAGVQQARVSVAGRGSVALDQVDGWREGAGRRAAALQREPFTRQRTGEMRPPRYRFPDSVRSTTRAMASRMVADATIAETPEQLDEWISQEPGVRAALERGGYNSAFTSRDLLPLLQVFIVKAGGSPPDSAVPPPSARYRWMLGLLFLVAIILLGIAVATGVFPRGGGV
jgi:hypothetical protein